MERVAIYGGAFNMPTIGHRQLIEKLSVTGKVDRIIFSPDGERADKEYGISLEKRILILKAFYYSLKRDGFPVEFESHFVENNIKTTTMEAEYFYTDRLGLDPFHIFGTDVVGKMQKWRGNENGFLERGLNKIFIRRKGFKIPDFSNMENYVFLDLGIREISSSAVKEMLRTKVSVDGFLTPEVAEIVLKEGLYV